MRKQSTKTQSRYAQRDDDTSFAVSGLKFLEVDPSLCILLILVVYTRRSATPGCPNEIPNPPICNTKKVT